MATEVEDPKAPDWRFRVKEVANNVYRVDGHHPDGRTVSRTGVGEQTLAECIEDACTLPPGRPR